MTTLSAIPPFPALSDRAAGTYNSKAYAFGAHMGGPFVGEINAVRNEVEALNEGTGISAASAASASATALANANYKGEWASLTGALATPASFSYNGDLYILLVSVADITAHVPGVSINIGKIEYTQSLQLINTVYAAGVASVEWTNFVALATEYASLRVLADGIIGSAASANLNGQVKFSDTWQLVTQWQRASTAGAFSSASLGGTSQLKNTVAKALALDMNIQALGRLQVPAIQFCTLGGLDDASGNTFPLFGGSYFANTTTPTTPIQGLRILASTGTLTGTFRLYGVRK